MLMDVDMRACVWLSVAVCVAVCMYVYQCHSLRWKLR